MQAFIAGYDILNVDTIRLSEVFDAGTMQEIKFVH